MIPQRLELKNFLSYGENHPVLDLEHIHVACLSGANGHGKSALLDAMVWAVWGEPRGGTRSGDDLIRHGAREMVVSLEFDSGGIRYRVTRSRLNRGKTFTGSLHFESRGDDQWRSLDGGTAGDTQKVINDILHMDHNTFVHASFIAQGRADAFVALTPQQRKQVLGDILELDQYDKLSEDAKAEAKIAQVEATRLSGQLQDLDRELAVRPQRVEELKEAEHEERDAGLLVDRLTAERTSLQSELHRLEDLDRQVQQVRDAQRRADANLQSLDTELHTLEGRLRSARSMLDHAEEIEQRVAEYERLDELERSLADRYLEWCSARDALQSVENEIAREQTRLEVELRSTRQRVVQLEGRLPRTGELEAEHTRFLAQRSNLERVEGQRVELQNSLDAIRGLLAVRAEDGKRLKIDLDKAQERIDLLGENQVCPVCGQELGLQGLGETQRHLQAERAGLEQAVNQARSDWAKSSKESKGLEQQLAELEAQLGQRPAVERSLGDVERRLSRVAEDQQQYQEAQQEEQALTALLAGKLFAQELRAELPPLQTRLASIEYDQEEHKRVRAKRDQLRDAAGQLRQLDAARATVESGEAHQRSLQTQRAEVEGERDRLAAQLQELAVGIADIDQARAAVAAKERELQSTAVLHRAAIQRLGEARQMVNWLDERAAERTRLVPVRDDALRDVNAYTQLAEAFGKNGIQEMIVEDALPEIEDFANDLLSRLSNGRMHVSLATQRTGRTGAVISTLDVNVSDELGTRPYELFSGGEKFRINFAIRIALSRLLAHRAGAPLQMLAIDEGFGSQDREGCDRLIEGIRMVQDDFERILVITHMEEIKDAFPVRIEVTKTAEGSTFTIT